MCLEVREDDAEEAGGAGGDLVLRGPEAVELPRLHPRVVLVARELAPLVPRRGSLFFVCVS